MKSGVTTTAHNRHEYTSLVWLEHASVISFTLFCVVGFCGITFSKYALAVLLSRWNFSEVSLCNLVRSSLNPVLDYSKPSFIGKEDER